MIRTNGARGAGRPTPQLDLVFTGERKDRRYAIRFTASCLPDTGATRSLMSKKMADNYKLHIKPTDQKVTVANGEEIDVAGAVSYTHLTLPTIYSV